MLTKIVDLKKYDSKDRTTFFFLPNTTLITLLTRF